MLLGTNKTVLIANETAARRLGTTVDEITGQKKRAFPPEVAVDRDKHVAGKEVARTGKPIRFRKSAIWAEIFEKTLFTQSSMTKEKLLPLQFLA